MQKLTFFRVWVFTFVLSSVILLPRLLLVSMSSSTFSFDALDELLASATLTTSTNGDGSGTAPSVNAASNTSTASTVLSSVSSGPSGKSPVSSLVSPGGGLPNKKLLLWIPSGSQSFCFGCIGASKFCIKSDSCPVIAHKTKFTPKALHGYLQETDSRAFVDPSFNLTNLSSAQRLRLHGVSLSFQDWAELFTNLAANNPPKWLSFQDPSSPKNPTMVTTTFTSPPHDEILSPLAQVTQGSLLASVPTLSFDDSVDAIADDFNELDELSLSHVVHFIKKFRNHFSSLKQKWNKAFLEIDSSYGLLVHDLRELQTTTSLVVQDIGSPPADSILPAPIWSSLSLLNNNVTSLSTTVNDHTSDVNQLLHTCSTVQQSVLELEHTSIETTHELSSHITTLTNNIRALEQRFLRLVPFLQSLHRGGSYGNMNTSPSTASPGLYATERPGTSVHVMNNGALEQKFKEMEISLSELKSLHASRPSDLFTGDNPQIRELQAQVKQLQLRVVGKGVQVANKVFQSFDDVLSWVPLHLPNRRYGLFVDGVSIFEFFTNGHIDAETTYSSFYSQHRIGFASTYEARIASSVQNLFPTVFGKTDANVDTADTLPALPNPDKWDSNDGNTGLRYQITRNMADVELQLSESISTILREYPEALHIARECLHQAKRFALELCQFITLDFQKWKYRGHSKKDAWKMTAVCVRRIFEELYSERVIARDGYDQKDQEYTTARYLWATWKAHAVMEKYLRHQFYEHPSISAVLARQLAENYVKPDDTQGAKIKALETAVQKLQSKYDTLRTDNDKDKQKNGKGKPGAGSS